jgi:hypothetical protein
MPRIPRFVAFFWSVGGGTCNVAATTWRSFGPRSGCAEIRPETC